MITILVAGVIWMVNTLAGVDTETKRTSDKVQTLEVAVEGMYRSDVAKRDISVLSSQITGIERRVDDIEKRVHRVEDRGR